MEPNLLDRMLNTYLTSQTPVVITLQNKVRIAGRIKAFDSYVVLMDGNKREIVYRHAMSSISAGTAEEPRRQPSSNKASHDKAPRTEQQAASKPPAKQHHSPSVSTAPSESSINTSMKEGLLKWMQEQKATK